jgi:DNA polymerase III subunit beta
MAVETTEGSAKAPRSRVARSGRKQQAPALDQSGGGQQSTPASPRRRRAVPGIDAGADVKGATPDVGRVPVTVPPQNGGPAPEAEPVAQEAEVAELAAEPVEPRDGGADGASACAQPALQTGTQAPPPIQMEVREMAFAVQPQVLRAGMAAVIAALPGKTTLPVLSCIRIETEGDGLIRLTATDLDTTVTRTIAGTVGKPGVMLLPGKKLDEIASELPDGCTLDVRLREDAVHLWCGETRTRYRLATIPVHEFPSPPEVPWESAFPVPTATLKLLIARTSFAASTEETRPILNGVLWELGEREMSMVATNGHRLAVTRMEAAGAAPAAGEGVFAAADDGAEDAESRDVIIHPRPLALITRLAQDGEEVRVARKRTYVGFRGPGWEIVTRTIPGPYPNYRSVIPQDNDRALVADRVALVAAVRRMAIVASDQTHRIRFVLGGPMMRVAVETPDLGTAHEDVPVDYQGGPLEIGFNAQYLLELLRYLPAGDVRMCFSTSERAALLGPVEDAEGISTEMLLMPLRLRA